MNRNSRNAGNKKNEYRPNSQAAKRVSHHRRKRRRRRQSSLLPALLFTLGILAVIVLAIKLMPKPAASVPAASEVQTRAEVGTADLRATEAPPVITLPPQTAEPTPAPDGCMIIHVTCTW